MSSYEPKMDSTFREYADLELRCHFLLLEGKEDTPELAAAEDRMTILWENLDEIQRRSLGGIASDLNWIRRKFEPPPKGRKKPEEVTEAEQEELRAAAVGSDWHRFLHFLRLCAPLIPPDQLVDHRAKAYAAIHLPAFAKVFNEQVEIVPDNNPAVR